MLDRLRNFIRKHFTRTVLVSERAESDTTSKARTRSRRRRPAEVPPSERFVWGMVAIIIALIGVIALEAVYIAVTCTVNSELLTVISGLIGALVTAFLMGKRS